MPVAWKRIGRSNVHLAGILAALVLQACGLVGNDSDAPGGGTSRGFFDISAPGRLGALHLDSTYRVDWVPSPEAEGGTVRIALYREDDFRVQASASAGNSGTFTLSLPSLRIQSAYRIGSGSRYRLRISSVSDTGKWDFSPYFTLYSDYSGSIGVTTPEDGSVARLDSSLSIRWSRSGKAGTYAGIQLFKDTSLVLTVTTTASENGFYSWPRVQTSQGSGEGYRIRVFSVSDPAISGMSEPFRIASSYDGTLSVTDPGSGDTLTAGSYAHIGWDVDGNAGNYASLHLYRDSVLVRSISGSVSLASDSMTWMVTPGLASGSRYRARMTSLSDAGIHAFSEYFSIRGVDPDEYETDDSLGMAKEIPVDGTAQERTLSYLDTDWLHFQAAAGKRYLVSVKSAVSLSAGVYDSAGSPLGSSQTGAGFQMVVDPPRAGRHHLRIGYYLGYGGYSIAVKERDSSDISTLVEFASPDSGDTWAAGSFYTIRWTPDSLFYGRSVALALYRDSVYVSSITASVTNSGSYSWSIPSGTLSSDRYRIRIANYSNPQVHAFSPYFTISGVTGDSYEPDNTQATAGEIAAGDSAQARSVTQGDYDWIRFKAESGRKYLAVFNSAVSLSAGIYDSLGSIQASRSGTQFSVLHTATRTGTHYLRVGPVGSYGNYTVRLIEYEDADGGFPASFTAPDTSTTWAAGASYSIAWARDTALYGPYVSLALYRDSALVTNIYSSLANSGAYTWNVPAGLPTSSRYRIRITSGSNTLVYGHSARFTISGVAPDAFEPDNQRSQAKDISADGAPQARNLTSNDSDWVRFDGDPARTYLFSVSTNYTVYLYILDSLGLQVGSGSGTRFTATVKPTRKGSHFVRLQSSSSTVAVTYSLSLVSYAAGPDGLPVAFSSPDTSATWAAGTAYPVTWAPDTLLFSRYVSLSLYRDTVLVQSFSTSYLNSGTATVTLPASLASGSGYRIRLANSSNPALFGSSKPFTISGLAPDPLEPNDVPAEAESVAVDQGKQALSLTYRDKDWFRFAGKAQMLYLIQATSTSSLPTTLRLWSNAGSLQLSTASKTGIDSVNGIAWVCPEEGEYMISVEPYSTSTSYFGPYSFEIKEVDPATYKFTVSAPAEAAVARLGQPLSIQWSDPSGIKGMVDLFLYNTEGVVQTIAANVANSGAYSWSVPATLGARDGYHVRVISRLNSAINGQSAAFSVAP
jgi:hypothetical protein